MSPAARKLRLLCLHGHLQSGESFRVRTGSLRKALKSRAELFYVDGPIRVQEAAGERGAAEEGADRGGASSAKKEDADRGSASSASETPSSCPSPLEPRSWWRVPAGRRPSMAPRLEGWEAARSAVERALREHAPIDGILGFSQGAAVAALYLAEEQAKGRRLSDEAVLEVPQELPGDGPPPLPKFAVIVAGFVPSAVSAQETFAAPPPPGHAVAIPTLHVMGESDDVIPLARSEALRERCEGGEALVHPGGHMVPTASGKVKKKLHAFLDRFAIQ